MPYPARTSREAILAAALELIETEGWAALSLRKLAARLHVQATSLYHHFPDRAALVDALGREAAGALLADLSRPANKGRLDLLAAAYLDFARRRPVLYNLLPDAAPESKEIWNLLLAELAPLTGNPDDTAAAVALWAYLHGFATLEAAGRFGASGPQGGFERGLRALLSGLRP